MTSATETRLTAASMFTAAMPMTFVVLWSSGFVGAKLGLAYAGPFTFLSLRFLLAGAVLLPLALLVRASWPKSWGEAVHIAVTGVLLNCGYIGGVFYALSAGMPATFVALIGGLQPIVTGVLAGPLLGEQVSVRQWLGLAMGFAGVVIVLWERLHVGDASAAAIATSVFSLASITVATLYQKRFCAQVPLMSGAVIQLAASAALMLPLAASIEGFAVSWTAEFVFALGWVAILLSIGALSLLWMLVRRGAASKVSSLFYLTPPVTGVMATAIAGERLGLPALIGMAIVVLGISLATRETTRPPAARHHSG